MTLGAAHSLFVNLLLRSVAAVLPETQPVLSSMLHCLYLPRTTVNGVSAKWSLHVPPISRALISSQQSTSPLPIYARIFSHPPWPWGAQMYIQNELMDGINSSEIVSVKLSSRRWRRLTSINHNTRCVYQPVNCFSCVLCQPPDHDMGHLQGTALDQWANQSSS